MTGLGSPAEKPLTAEFAKKGREEREAEQPQEYPAFLCDLREAFANFAVKSFSPFSPPGRRRYVARANNHAITP